MERKYIASKENNGFISMDKILIGMCPIGGVICWTNLTIPTGFLICNGQSIDKTIYPNLFNILGYAYGGSGNNFNIPALQGQFIRGRDNMGIMGIRGYDSVRNLGDIQLQDYENHRHSVSGSVSDEDDHVHSMSVSVTSDGDHDHEFEYSPPGGGSSTALIACNVGGGGRFEDVFSSGSHSHSKSAPALVTSGSHGHSHTLSASNDGTTGLSGTKPRNRAFYYLIRY